VRDQVSHPYKTGRTIVLYILIFKQWDFFIFATASRPALGPIQLPIAHLPLIPRLRIRGAIRYINYIGYFTSSRTVIMTKRKLKLKSTKRKLASSLKRKIKV
jgi:hypothetical protein